MRSTTLISLLALGLGTSLTTAQFLNQTAPFNLVLRSLNDTINGSTLGACHEGAAIEGLCLGSSSPGTLFTLNYTTNFTPDPAYGTEGYLTYELRGGNVCISILLLFTPCSDIIHSLISRHP